jgi:hypothetical protein
MAGALLKALRDRVDREPRGRIVLPTGTHAVADVAKVLRAIDRTHHHQEEEITR